MWFNSQSLTLRNNAIRKFREPKYLCSYSVTGSTWVQDLALDSLYSLLHSCKDYENWVTPHLQAYAGCIHHSPQTLQYCETLLELELQLLFINRLHCSPKQIHICQVLESFVKFSNKQVQAEFNWHNACHGNLRIFNAIATPDSVNFESSYLHITRAEEKRSSSWPGFTRHDLFYVVYSSGYICHRFCTALSDDDIIFDPHTSKWLHSPHHSEVQSQQASLAQRSIGDNSLPACWSSQEINFKRSIYEKDTEGIAWLRGLCSPCKTAGGSCSSILPVLDCWRLDLAGKDWNSTLQMHMVSKLW